MSKKLAFLLVLAFAAAALPAHAGLKGLLTSEGKLDDAEISAHYKERLLVPKLDLPRGTLVLQGGVVDFAEIGRETAANGVGPAKGKAVTVAEVAVWKDKIRFIFREPGKTRDPRGLGIVLRAAKGESFERYHDVQMLDDILARLFEDAPQAPVSQPPPPAPPPLRPPPMNTGLPQSSAQTEAPEKPAPPGEARIRPGMSKAELHEALGEPMKRDVAFEGEDVVERWFYEFRDLSSMLLVLRNGKVESVKEF